MDETWMPVMMFAGAIALFLLLRIVVLWYYKIDERLTLQKEQIKILSKILKAVQKEELKGIDSEAEKKTA